VKGIYGEKRAVLPNVNFLTVTIATIFTIFTIYVFCDRKYKYVTCVTSFSWAQFWLALQIADGNSNPLHIYSLNIQIEVRFKFNSLPEHPQQQKMIG
jgi:hypothetical protein